MKVLEEEPRVEVMEDSWSPLQAARDFIAGGAADEPFYVSDLRELAERHARWRALMPRVEPFYAVKCNDDKMLLRTLAALGTGFDCASRGEIDLVMGLGVAPERIIYANTIKMVSHIRYAASAGVELMTFDSEAELIKIKQNMPSAQFTPRKRIIYANTIKMASHIRYAASAGVELMTFDSEAELIKIKQNMPHAQVVLRIRCDATHSQISFGEKFGCDPVTEAPALLRLAAVLGLDLIGVSFHVGTMTEEPEAYARAIRHCRDVFNLAAEAGLARMRLVDIGGGFPGHSGSSIQEISAVVNEALDKYIPDRGVRVIAEPGRYFAQAAYTLAVMVHGKREVAVADEASKTHTLYYVNAGVYSAFCSAASMVDQFDEPILLYVGSWLLFRNLGAYTRTLSTNFNGFTPPRVRSFVDRRLWLVLKNRSPFSECHFSLDSPTSVAPCPRRARSSDQASYGF